MEIVRESKPRHINVEMGFLPVSDIVSASADFAKRPQKVGADMQKFLFSQRVEMYTSFYKLLMLALFGPEGDTPENRKRITVHAYHEEKRLCVDNKEIGLLEEKLTEIKFTPYGEKQRTNNYKW